MLSDLWTDLDEGEPISRIRWVAPGLYTGHAEDGWIGVCKWASCFEPGQWWPKEKGCTWCNGSRHVWIVTPDQVEGIMQARSICEGFGLQCGWSIGSAARALLRFCGPPQHGYKSSLGLLSGTGYSYQDCTPGEYPGSTQWDVKSYYYDLLRRLPTWRLTIRAGARLHFHADYPGELARREAVLRAVEGHKLLRNALVGCMVGRQGGSVYYHQGRKCSHRGAPGYFRGAGLLVVRSAWELTRIAAVEVDSKLTNVDCVICQGGLYPSVWGDLGLTVEVRAEGDSEVCAPVIYKVGPRQTEFYRRGSRFRDTIARPPDPGRDYHRLWLRPPA